MILKIEEMYYKACRGEHLEKNEILSIIQESDSRTAVQFFSIELAKIDPNYSISSASTKRYRRVHQVLVDLYAEDPEKGIRYLLGNEVLTHNKVETFLLKKKLEIYGRCTVEQRTCSGHTSESDGDIMDFKVVERELLNLAGTLSYWDKSILERIMSMNISNISDKVKTNTILQLNKHIYLAEKLKEKIGGHHNE